MACCCCTANYKFISKQIREQIYIHQHFRKFNLIALSIRRKKKEKKKTEGHNQTEVENMIYNTCIYQELTYQRISTEVYGSLTKKYNELECRRMNIIGTVSTFEWTTVNLFETLPIPEFLKIVLDPLFRCVHHWKSSWILESFVFENC